MAMSTGSKVFLTLIVLVVGGLGGGLWFVNDQLSGTPGGGTPVAVEVPSGATAGGVADQLVEEGVVKNALVFRLVARTRDLGSQLRAGTYDLETGMSVDEAIDALLEGPAPIVTTRFTVIEGLSIPLTLESLARQFDAYTEADFQAVLDERLAAGTNEEGTLQLPDWVPPLGELPSEVRHPFEGLLFPETYEVLLEETPLQILQRMVDQTDRVMRAIPQEDIAAARQRGVSRYEGLIIASLIERETRVNDERPVVSSVIANRLEDGQLLQIDATVLYALGKWKARVLNEDTSVPSPYNTYVTPGLPPTPIAGAGAASLAAAFAPAETPFRYYVLAPECDGTHVFAETLDEHNRNVARFRESGRCLDDQ